MVTKLKNLIINDSRAKFILLLLLFLSLSILFETIYDLNNNFIDINEFKYLYNEVAIPCFYYFGPPLYLSKTNLKFICEGIALLSCILAILFFIFYKKNNQNKVKFLENIITFFSNVKIEFTLILILILLTLRFYIFTNTKMFYNTNLIVFNFIILSVIYIIYENIKHGGYNPKDMSITCRFFSDLVSRYNRKTINKKLAIAFLISIVIQAVIQYIALVLFMRIYYANAIVIEVLFTLVSIIACSYIYNFLSTKFNYINNISKNIKNIENGNLKYKLEVIGDDEISALSKSINNITDGLEAAVDANIKSERMKTELITNVSHDLKTPLTSILSYVDMLKNNDLDKETINDYINILHKKSQRLKLLIEDIFEASKLSSGDVEFNITKTDIKELLIQSIVELEDKIQNSNLDFIIETPEDSVFTMIDGKKTWRVFENLIGNILKYSMKNTRVYIDMFIKDENIIVTFKNISNDKLNLKPEELIERFRRGDISRNTDGSGLGLSISQNIIELQNATMEIIIDADLFKVTLAFKKIN
ncbi:sensor histidine kinase [Clostridioides sp. ES-W-0016-02]|uniref:HAMP domain-containing sensor histidine kinase n=1 Tax=Clostridioides sp. ES-W-0016-02 TaxID=2770788 RepID=UPI001D0FD746|nr:sensor histidine kinase [Clostridioides sp. ES-W-0016-02]